MQGIYWSIGIILLLNWNHMHRVLHWHVVKNKFFLPSKPETNTFKMLPIIPSCTSQKNVTHYSSFLFSYIIAYYSYFVLLAFINSSPEKHGLETYFVAAIV